MHWKSLFASKETKILRKLLWRGNRFHLEKLMWMLQPKWNDWDPTPIPPLYMWINDVVKKIWVSQHSLYYLSHHWSTYAMVGSRWVPKHFPFTFSSLKRRNVLCVENHLPPKSNLLSCIQSPLPVSMKGVIDYIKIKPRSSGLIFPGSKLKISIEDTLSTFSQL